MRVAFYVRYAKNDRRNGGVEETMITYEKHMKKKGIETLFVVRGNIIKNVSELKDFKPDVILISKFLDLYEGYFLKKAMRVPVLVFAHDEFDVKGFKPPFNFFSILNTKKLSKKVDAIVALNKNVYNLVKEETGVVPYLSYSGFDTPNCPKKTEYRCYSAEGRPFQFISIGRFVKEKGVDTVADAFWGFNMTYPNSKCIICGDGPYRKEFMEKYHHLIEDGRLEVPGYVPEVEKLLAESDIFLNMTRAKEGLVFANILALRVGVPVYTLDSGAVSEVIKKYENGYVFNDMPTSIVSEVVWHVIENEVIFRYAPALKNRADKGFETAEFFSGERATEDLLKVMKSVLNDNDYYGI